MSSEFSVFPAKSPRGLRKELSRLSLVGVAGADLAYELLLHRKLQLLAVVLQEFRRKLELISHFLESLCTGIAGTVKIICKRAVGYSYAVRKISLF